MTVVQIKQRSSFKELVLDMMMCAHHRERLLQLKLHAFATLKQRPSEVCMCLPMSVWARVMVVSVDYEILDIAKCINNIHHLKWRHIRHTYSRNKHTHAPYHILLKAVPWYKHRGIPWMKLSRPELVQTPSVLCNSKRLYCSQTFSWLTAYI